MPCLIFYSKSINKKLSNDAYRVRLSSFRLQLWEPIVFLTVLRWINGTTWITECGSRATFLQNRYTLYIKFFNKINKKSKPTSYFCNKFQIFVFHLLTFNRDWKIEICINFVISGLTNILCFFYFHLLKVQTDFYMQKMTIVL